MNLVIMVIEPDLVFLRVESQVAAVSLRGGGHLEAVLLSLPRVERVVVAVKQVIAVDGRRRRHRGRCRCRRCRGHFGQLSVAELVETVRFVGHVFDDSVNSPRGGVIIIIVIVVVTLSFLVIVEAIDCSQWILIT